VSRRLLILGGTGEAVALAGDLAARRPDLHVVTSLAGATRAPVRPAGAVRIGGFGGSEGLATYLRSEAIDALVDATHPFAATMAQHAALAAARTGTPRLKLLRPMWPRLPDDRWIEVDDATGAAAALVGLGVRRVLLTLGGRDLGAFAGLDGIAFVVRLIEPPAEPLPLGRAELLLARGPFDEAAERALMADRAIEALVTKAAGGEATAAKLAAARALALPVVMIRRPPPPAGETAPDVATARRWVDARLPL